MNYIVSLIFKFKLGKVLRKLLAMYVCRYIGI